MPAAWSDRGEIGFLKCARLIPSPGEPVATVNKDWIQFLFLFPTPRDCQLSGDESKVPAPQPAGDLWSEQLTKAFARTKNNRASKGRDSRN